MAKITRNNDLYVHIGDKIKLCRISRNISLREVAQNLNISSPQLRKYEIAQDRISASRLYELSKFLNVPIEYFYQ